LKHPVDIDSIEASLPNVNKNHPKEYDSEKSLLHGNHATGTKKEEWKKVLSASLQEQIHHEFSWWLKSNNYPL
jgi:hypothetical protein